jgi:hypothetical protein
MSDVSVSPARNFLVYAVIPGGYFIPDLPVKGSFCQSDDPVFRLEWK